MAVSGKNGQESHYSKADSCVTSAASNVSYVFIFPFDNVSTHFGLLPFEAKNSCDGPCP